MGDVEGPAVVEAADERMGAPYVLRTLGRLAMVAPDGRDEPSLTTRPRKLALLAWLALRPDRSATRDRMVGTFWGGRDDDRARNSLSDALSHLRRVLGREAIRARGEEVRLAADAPLEVDALALTDAASCNNHARVVSLYRGSFLDGVHIDDAHEFDDWCERMRTRLGALFARSAAERCRALAASGEWDACRLLAERWIETEPASAEAACVWLDAIAAPRSHASRAAALVAYRSLALRLDRDLGIAPASEVTRRAEGIRAAMEAAPLTPASTAVTATSASNASNASNGTSVAAAAAGSAGATLPDSPITPSPRSARAPATPVAPVAPAARTPLAMGAAVATLMAIGTVAFVRAQSGRAPDLDPSRVVVKVFENRTHDSTLADVGRVAAQWISRGLAETHLFEVVDVPPSPADGREVDARELGQEVEAGSVVTGSYVMRGDSLVLEARIVDAENGRVVRAVDPVVTHSADPLVGVELLRQRVSGALASELDMVITALVREGSQPPTYEAYLAWVRGLDVFAQRDFQGSIALFLQAAARDSNFVAPLLWAAASYGNTGQWQTCDSLLRVVEAQRTQLGPLDRGLLDLWIATVKGDIPGRYTAARQMLAEAPASENALFLAGYAATRVFRANEAITLLRRLPVERSRVRWDLYGSGLAWSYHVGERHEEELVEAQRRRRSAPHWLLAMEEEGRALAVLGRAAELDRLTADIASIAAQPARSAGLTLLVVAREAFVHGQSEAGRATLARFDAWEEGQPVEQRQSFALRRLVAMARHFQRNWPAADTLFTALVVERPQNADLLGWLGAVAAQRGDTARALRLTATLATLDVPYLHGAHTLARARIAAALGRRADAIALTRQSISEGQLFDAIHVVPELLPLRGDPEFDALFRIVG